MAAPPRIRLSPIKLAPAPAIVPIVNPDTPAVVAPPESTSVAVPPLSVVAPLSFAPSGADVPPAPAAVASGVGEPTVAVTPDAANSPVPGPAPLPALTLAARPTSAPSAQTDEPVSTGLMTASAAPARIRASSLVIKWSAIAAMLLLVAFAAMKFLLPVVIEMRQAKVPNPVADKNAPTAVRAIQATRQVVAKSDANVAYLNEVVSAVENKPVEVKPAPAPVLAPVAVEAPPAPSDLSRFHDAVAQLKVDGVVRGATPRAFIDGRFVKHGEIINRALGLRFVGVDPDEHMLLFTNADNVTFRKRY